MNLYSFCKIPNLTLRAHREWTVVSLVIEDDHFNLPQEIYEEIWVDKDTLSSLRVPAIYKLYNLLHQNSDMHK